MGNLFSGTKQATVKEKFERFESEGIKEKMLLIQEPPLVHDLVKKQQRVLLLEKTRPSDLFDWDQTTRTDYDASKASVVGNEVS